MIQYSPALICAAAAAVVLLFPVDRVSQCYADTHAQLSHVSANFYIRRVMTPTPYISVKALL